MDENALKPRLESIYDLLSERFGHRNWWPADTPFEVCVGAILTQNTSWKNVEKAIANLKKADCMDALRLHEISAERLAELVRPAGYFNVKARRLKNFIARLVEGYDGSLDRLFHRPAGELRLELLEINGVGRETADSMILYAANKPVFVIDAYTRRVLERHGIAEAGMDYDAVQAIFHRNLDEDLGVFNDFHAQFVAVGSNFCGRKPKCVGCPLEGA